ncbi:hypothetical protein R6Q57_001312 [Mikania cordata]
MCWTASILANKQAQKKKLEMCKPGSTIDKNISIYINSHSKDLVADSMVISSPMRHVINVSKDHAQEERSSSANLMHNTNESKKYHRACRAFWALKGITRLQALARGHLVRRQAVATLTCMRAIVEFQALVRGQRVRLYANGPQVLHRRTHGDHAHKERANLLQTSLKSENLSKNAFAVKLVTSSKTTMSLNVQYDPDGPNSVKNWLERWSSSHFWDPLPLPKKPLGIKPKRKQTKSQSQEIETTRPKRSIRKVPATTLDNSNTKTTTSIPTPSVGDKSLDVNLPVGQPQPLVENETNGKVENVESNNKENKKTRRRKSFPAKQEYSEIVSQNTPTVPSYMVATESAKAKLRAEVTAKAVEYGAENGFVRRHYLPSSTGKLGLQSPRVQNILHPNGKGGSRTSKPQISSRDGRFSRVEKVSGAIMESMGLVRLCLVETCAVVH